MIQRDVIRGDARAQYEHIGLHQPGLVRDRVHTIPGIEQVRVIPKAADEPVIPLPAR